MKHSRFNQAFTRMFALITLCFTAFSFTGNLGLDTYEVYLNDKLILKNSVNQPLHLRALKLGKTNNNDQLRINYIHCMGKGPGKGRSLILKNEQGNVLKKWTFADVTGSDLSMVVPVKELLQAEGANTHHKLSLYYSAKELPEGEMIAFFPAKQ